MAAGMLFNMLEVGMWNGLPAEFCSSSQDQVNSAVAAKEHSRVHLCLGLALRKPSSQHTRLLALVRIGEDGTP
ncbi:unnamed protein product [Nezara viridula]|uniref:Uncharacterized protein n=1 Tax=Nezara viridula TaxID=85310 RepID=A0A9P0H877_NEZVI|nr:unnamed protein product [Nezara viridula]